MKNRFCLALIYVHWRTVTHYITYIESHNKVGFAQFHSNLASSVPVYLNAFGLEKNPVDDKRIQCILTKMS